MKGCVVIFCVFLVHFYKFKQVKTMAKFIFRKMIKIMNFLQFGWEIWHDHHYWIQNNEKKITYLLFSMLFYVYCYYRDNPLNFNFLTFFILLICMFTFNRYMIFHISVWTCHIFVPVPSQFFFQCHMSCLFYVQ